MRILTQDDARANLGPEEVALRLQAETLWKAQYEAGKAYDAAHAKLWDAKCAELEAIKARHEAELEAFEAAITNDPSLADVKSAYDAAWAAWEACPLGDLETAEDLDGVEHPVHCVVSGLVLLEGDAVVYTKWWQGDPALRGALGLPPLADESDETEDVA